MCAECHSTNLRKNYDAGECLRDDVVGAQRRLRGVPRSGLGPRAWARKEGDRKRFERRPRALRSRSTSARASLGARSPPPATRSRSAPRERRARSTSCARCHARRRQISDDYVHGQRRSRHASALAARRGPLLARRPDARRGLQLRLVPAEQDVRAGRHLHRLPRAALAEARGAGQRGVRALPSAGEVRRAAHTSSPGRDRLVRRARPVTCRPRPTWSSIRATTTRLRVPRPDLR